MGVSTKNHKIYMFVHSGGPVQEINTTTVAKGTGNTRSQWCYERDIISSEAAEIL